MIYIAIVDSSYGEEFIAYGITIDGAVDSLNNIVTDYNPEDIRFFKAEQIEVKVKTTFTYVEE